MTLLTRDLILKADDLPREKVAVPEWGGDVFVRAMSGTERDAWEADIISEDGKPSLKNMRAKLAACCLVDDKGNRLFSNADVEVLGRKSARALERVVRVAQKLNRLGEAQLEEVRGN